MDVSNIQYSGVGGSDSRRSPIHSIVQWQPMEDVQNTAAVKKIEKMQQEPLLTDAEEKFFEQLYPNSVPEIQAHHTYKRDGARIALNTGTVIDRKG